MQAVGGASILMTGIDILTHVTAHLSNVLTDHEAARRPDAASETLEKIEILIEGIAMTVGLFHENTTLILALQALRSLDRVHWTHTVDRPQSDSRHIPGTPTGPTPHSSHHASPSDRLGPQADSFSRRSSLAIDPSSAKDPRREPGKDEALIASRAGSV